VGGFETLEHVFVGAEAADEQYCLPQVLEWTDHRGQMRGRTLTLWPRSWACSICFSTRFMIWFITWSKTVFSIDLWFPALALGSYELATRNSRLQLDRIVFDPVVFVILYPRKLHGIGCSVPVVSALDLKFEVVCHPPPFFFRNTHEGFFADDGFDVLLESGIDIRGSA
jgi:hypothetical protein